MVGWKGGREGGTWEKSYPELEIQASRFFHANLCPLGVLAEVHLDEGVSLVLVDDAGLDLAKAAEDLSQFHVGAAVENDS